MMQPVLHQASASLCRLLGLFLACHLLLAPVVAQDRYSNYISKTPPRTPAEQTKMFHLPEGFRIELVASEPEIIKPINMNFDAAGNLLVTQSIEYPFAVPAGRKGRDTIKRIVDTNADGVPEKVTTFADGLSIPIGVTPISDGVLGFSIPYIYRFVDSDGDGKVDRREVAYRKIEQRDTHGLINGFTWWIDGWVYGCHGFANRSTVSGSDKKSIRMESGNTFRLRSDGSHIEHFSHGQVNPFGLAFDPMGNLFSADCHTKPLYLLLRGAHYPSFGRPHDGLGFGPELLQHLHGSTGIAGVVYYAAENFPKQYADTLFIGNPVTGRINHDRLEQHGSSYKAIEQPDFLSCDDPWFRPVDVKLAADGSIYIADFYNRIIGHYEVPLTHPLRDKTRGRIWRISYVGNESQPRGTAPADLTKASPGELLEALGDANIVVRTHATHQLVHRVGSEAVGPVRELISGNSTPEQRAHGLWVLARLDALEDGDSDGDGIVKKLADDESRLVRVHVLRVLAERQKWQTWQRELVLNKFGDADPFVRRTAADAVGKHPHSSNVQALIDLWGQTAADDVLLIHTVRMALRDTIGELKNLPELEQRFRGSPETLERLAGICLGIKSSQAAEYQLNFYQSREPRDPQIVEVLQHISRNVDDKSRLRLSQLADRFRKADDGVQRSVLLTLYRTAAERGQTVPDEQTTWAAELAANLMDSKNEKTVRSGIEFTRELRLKAATGKLIVLTTAGSPHANLRAVAVDALAQIDGERAVRAIARLLDDGQTPAGLRRQMAESLGRINSPQSRGILVALLKVSPEDLSLTIARSLSGSRQGARALLAAAEKGTASPRLLQDRVVNERLQSARIPVLKSRLEKLLDGLPPGDERLRKLIVDRKKSFQNTKHDVALGAKLFEKNCSACHQIKGKGAKVGPELDGVGLRGLDRLLEDVLDPNRNVDANFRATNIAYDGGRIVSGLVLRKEGKILILVDDKGKERRILTDTIEDQKQSKLSAMPANVSELVTEAEFHHLMAFLLSQQRKVKPAPKRN